MLCYDISDDKKRMKIHRLCTNYGWIMVQKSLYLKGGILTREKDSLMKQIKKIDLKYPNIFDSIVFINVASNQLRTADQIGYEFPFSSFLGDSRLEII